MEFIIEQKPFGIGHVALYSKNWYQSSGNVWDDVIKCLNGDGYTPLKKRDVINIMLGHVLNIQTDPESFTSKMIEAIEPSETWKCGYYHSDHTWVKPMNQEKYDYQTAILHFFLSILGNSKLVDLGELPTVDETILPRTIKS
jgi:hypothetical protein